VEHWSFRIGDDFTERPCAGTRCWVRRSSLPRSSARTRIAWSWSQGAEISRPSELFARVSDSEDKVERIEVSGFAAPVGGGWFDDDLRRGRCLIRVPDSGIQSLEEFEGFEEFEEFEEFEPARSMGISLTPGPRSTTIPGMNRDADLVAV